MTVDVRFVPLDGARGARGGHETSPEDRLRSVVWRVYRVLATVLWRMVFGSSVGVLGQLSSRRDSPRASAEWTGSEYLAPSPGHQAVVHTLSVSSAAHAFIIGDSRETVTVSCRIW